MQHTHYFTQTTACSHINTHALLVSAVLRLAFPGVALSAWAFHTSFFPDCVQHWSDGQRENACNQADSWSEATTQKVVVKQRSRVCGSGARSSPSSFKHQTRISQNEGRVLKKSRHSWMPVSWCFVVIFILFSSSKLDCKHGLKSCLSSRLHKEQLDVSPPAQSFYFCWPQMI